MKTKFLVGILCLLSAYRVGALEVVDDEGQRVKLLAPAQRIISLAPHITENLYSSGAGAQVVGAVDYSNFPEEALSIKSVGSYRAFNLETILSLKPDLVIAWRSGNGDEKISRLKALGLTVYVEDPKKLEDVADSIKTFGVLSGHSVEAERAGSAYLQTLMQLRASYAEQLPVSVFYQVWNDPMQTLNDKHLISDVIRLCGGRNVFGNAKSLAPHINIESVIAANPEVIIASGMGESRPEWLDEWRRWPAIRAVRNKHLYFIDPNHLQRHTTRILRGAQTLCEQLQRVR